MGGSPKSVFPVEKSFVADDIEIVSCWAMVTIKRLYYWSLFSSESPWIKALLYLSASVSQKTLIIGKGFSVINLAKNEKCCKTSERQVMTLARILCNWKDLSCLQDTKATKSFIFLFIAPVTYCLKSRCDDLPLKIGLFMKVKLFLSFTRSHFLQVCNQRSGWSEETVVWTQRAVIMWNMFLVFWVGFFFSPWWRQWKRGNKANGEFRMSHPLKIWRKKV